MRAPNFAPRCVCRGHWLKLASGKSIQQFQARGRIERQNRFVLSVDNGQIRRKLPQHGDSRRLIVNEYAAFTAGSNFAAHNQRAVFGFVQSVVLQNFRDGILSAAFALKYRRDHGALRAGANHLA